MPSVGSRVSIRYRLVTDPEHALTDVVGHVEAVSPQVLVRTKSDGVVEIAPDAIVAVRELSHRPVRASEIRALEHAAALAWPGTEQQWLAGWFLRSGVVSGTAYTSRANSAIPLDFSAAVADLPAVVDWYRDRGQPAWLAVPERLLRVSATGVKPTRVMVRDVADVPSGPGAVLTGRPDADWLAIYERDVPVEVLTAVIGGEVTFAAVPGAAVGRGAVTTAPDGTRWLGVSSVRVHPDRRRQGHARTICAALLTWGAEHGAEQVYVEVLADNEPAIALYESMGFRLHHDHRYIEAVNLLGSPPGPSL
ncbi:N-acetylglutamate synthase, CG3035 family [Mycolicibacterium komossense]|uniref:GNAT family N-acetyltransferase n=1 Tax=Mycolicibacterium komossense TaxID=1779 RepID=A0ABT3CL80_9MYCO|nr:GNAT family N-acetyltransferase [Mycolicibacterium komossense]MCV7230194.1 GNAT family N-acetyltransferase [Mycolicibacterium komossense]